MTMADMGDIIDAVQVRIALLIVHILAFAFDNFQWRLFEKERYRFTKSGQREKERVSLERTNFGRSSNCQQLRG